MAIWTPAETVRERAEREALAGLLLIAVSMIAAIADWIVA